MSSSRVLALLILGSVLFVTPVIHAQQFSATDFTVSNPVIFPGGFATSSSFSLTGVISQFAIGTSTSLTKNLFGGFLYFPFVSTPIISATPGDTQVSLTWTSADASVGWAVGSYSVGQSTTSGGPYSFSNVGNVL